MNAIRTVWQLDGPSHVRRTHRQDYIGSRHPTVCIFERAQSLESLTIDVSGLAYRKDLSVLPFDQRSSYEYGLLGIGDPGPNAQEVGRLAAYKRVIYERLVESLKRGVPMESPAVLVDQKYRTAILAEVRNLGIVTYASVEKCGQSEVDIECGDEFLRHLDEPRQLFLGR